MPWGRSPFNKEHGDFGGGVRQVCACTLSGNLVVDLIARHTAAQPSTHETSGKHIKYCMHRLSAERWDESYDYNPGSGLLTTDGRPAAF